MIEVLERMRINEDHMATCWMNVKEALEDGTATIEKKEAKNE